MGQLCGDTAMEGHEKGKRLSPAPLAMEVVMTTHAIQFPEFYTTFYARFFSVSRFT